jgi:hypothetical protein
LFHVMLQNTLQFNAFCTPMTLWTSHYPWDQVEDSFWIKNMNTLWKTNANHKTVIKATKWKLKSLMVAIDQFILLVLWLNNTNKSRYWIFIIINSNDFDWMRWINQQN